MRNENDLKKSTARPDIAVILAQAKMRLWEAERKSKNSPQNTNNQLDKSTTNGIVSQCQTNGDLS